MRHTSYLMISLRVGSNFVNACKARARDNPYNAGGEKGEENMKENGRRGSKATHAPAVQSEPSAAEMPASADMNMKETGTVRRVLLLLRCLADYPGESSQRIAQRLNLPRSSVHRLLAMLREDDYAANESDGGFTAGTELYRIAGKLSAQMPYRQLVEPYLQTLSARFQETSLLTLLARRQLKMFHAASGSPANPMRYNVTLNSLEPIVWGSTGRTLLAHLDDAEIHAAIVRGERSPVLGLVPDEVEIRVALDDIRRDGYAITHGHRTANAVGVAVPFFDAQGEITGSVGFLIPEFRWVTAPREEIIQALRDTATAISRQLGLAAAD